MKMLHYFKNPEEDSDSESLNDMRLEVEEFVPPYVPSDSSLSDDIFLGDTDDEAEELLYEMDSGSEYSMGDSESENSTETEYKSKMKLDEEKPTTSNNADGKTEPGRSGEKGDDEKTLDGITKKRSRIVTRSTSKELHTPPEIVLEDFITDICFHPERNIIALATIIGDIHLYKYDKDENKLLRSIEVHGKACRDVEFTADGKDLLTCSKDKSIMITDMATEKLKKFYESAHDDAINKIHVINDNLFVSGDDGGTIKLWDLRTKDAVFALKEVEDYITQMLSNDAKKLLLVTSGDGYLTTINLSARKLYVQSEPYEEELTCMGLYRGDTKLVVGTTKGRLYTYNWGQFGYHCDMYPGIKSHIGVMLPLTDRIACVAGEEGNLLACHIAPFRILGVIGQHNMPVEFLDISNTGEIIASSSHNNDVHFWNIKYLEEFTGIKHNEKHNTFKEKSHNLPSSNCINPTDFFAGLEKESSDDE